MSQVIHIFKKDIRHLWPEVLASLVVTAIFVKIYPVTWATGWHTSRMPDVLASVVAVLVPVTWWVMVTRLIHSEPLVGESQFWVTRPYQWQKLLAAKFLFLAAFLYVPFLIAQSLLLREAGFHPLSYLPGLFFNLFLITLILVVPIAAVATVTSGFARAVLWLLASVVYIAGLVAVAGLLFSSGDPDTYRGDIVHFVLCSLCIATIVLQYATRNVRLSRWLLVVAAATVGISAFPWPGSALVRIEYPPSSTSMPPPARLEFNSDSSPHVTAYGSSNAELPLQFPLTVSGVAAGTAVRANSVMVTITAPNGLHWSSFWQFDGQFFTSAEPNSAVDVRVNQAFLEKVKDLSVQVRITWAVSRIRAGATRQAITGEEGFTTPDGGICSQGGNDYTSFQCRFPMREPRLTRFTAMWSHQLCSQEQPPDTTPVSATGWAGHLGNTPADFGITSVWTSSLYFPGQGFTINERSNRTYLCPGTPISFTEYTLVDKSQIDLLIPAVRLPYRPNIRFQTSPAKAD